MGVRGKIKEGKENRASGGGNESERKPNECMRTRRPNLGALWVLSATRTHAVTGLARNALILLQAFNNPDRVHSDMSAILPPTGSLTDNPLLHPILVTLSFDSTFFKEEFGFIYQSPAGNSLGPLAN